MNRKFLIIILALLALFTCSCEKQPDRPMKPPKETVTSSETDQGEMGTGTVPGDYLYHSNDGVLLKYHIPTGTVSTVCPDPFCTHEEWSSACEFQVSWPRMAAIGNTLYYIVESDEQIHLRSYNGDDMKIEEIRTSNGMIGNPFTYNYYLYFWEKLPTKVEEEFKYTHYRLDTQSGVLEVIDCGYEAARIYTIEAGRIVWKRGNEYFSTDLNGDDEDVYVMNFSRPYGNYTYRWECSEDYKYYTKIYRKDHTTGEEIVISDEKLEFFYFYGDKILYFKPVENPEIWYSDEYGTSYDTLGGNVYVMNLDGSDKRLLCHVDDCPILGMSSHRNNQLCSGDWVGILTWCIYDGGVQETDMLIVNVVTGEYKHIKYNPYE